MVNENSHNRKKEVVMKRFALMLWMTFIVLSVAAPGWAQGRQGMMGGGMMGSGQGMGPGTMGYNISPDVPAKLPAPKDQEWVQKLREVLGLERLSYAQYTADAEKYNAYMPYQMVIPQEEDHVRAIERLFAAYGLPPDGQPGPVTETKAITEAYELCVKMERDLIPRYEWLVQNAGDRDSAGILNNILLQTRHHLVMFEHALRMGGTMGPGMMRGGGYGSGMGPGMMGGGMMGSGRGSGMGPGMMGPGYGAQSSQSGKPLDMKEAKAMMEDYLKSSRNPNLKLGKIKDTGNAFEAEVLTKNNALVDRVLIDKNTGWMRSAY
jgi:rubrerythrin